MTAATHLSQRVRHFRQAAGMTQEELAYAAGLAVRTIRNIESGDTRGSKTSRRLIAAALHTTPEELTKAVA